MPEKQTVTRKLRAIMRSRIKGKNRHAFNKNILLVRITILDFLTKGLLYILLLLSFLVFIVSKPSFAQSLMDLEQTGWF